MHFDEHPMQLDTIQKSLEQIKKKYETQEGGIQDLLRWVQDILEKELLDKEPRQYSKFDYQGNLIMYKCRSEEPGDGFFWISNDKTNMEYTYVISDTLDEQYGMSVIDENIKLTILDLKELAINFVTEFFQFKLYSSIASEGFDT